MDDHMVYSTWKADGGFFGIWDYADFIEFNHEQCIVV